MASASVTWRRRRMAKKVVGSTLPHKKERSYTSCSFPPICVCTHYLSLSSPLRSVTEKICWALKWNGSLVQWKVYISFMCWIVSKILYCILYLLCSLSCIFDWIKSTFLIVCLFTEAAEILAEEECKKLCRRFLQTGGYFVNPHIKSHLLKISDKFCFLKRLQQFKL